jgi:hypothetical protein
MKNTIALILVTGLSACGAAKQVNAQAVSYGVELMQCVDKSKTKEESQACRKEVDAKYGQCDGGCQ